MADGHQLFVNGALDEALTAAASEITVEQSVDAITKFRVKFLIDICDGAFTTVDDARLKPGGSPETEIAIVGTARDTAHCLVRGVVTKRRVSLANGGPGSFLEIEGQDMRVKMTRRPPAGRRHEGTSSAIARTVLERYGFTVDAAETNDRFGGARAAMHQPQTMTDFALVRKLAVDKSYYFWVETALDGGRVPTFRDTAFFKPSPPRPKGASAFPPNLALAPEPSITLSMNTSDPCSTIGTFELEADGEAPNATGPVSRLGDDRADLVSMNTEPNIDRLGTEVPAGEPRMRALVTAGGPDVAYEKNQAALNDAQWFVRARAETTTHALKDIVFPHRVVDVRGTGKLHDGRYWVFAVSHHLDASAHRMTIQLRRNALGGD
jgi:hypothetical protein